MRIEHVDGYTIVYADNGEARILEHVALGEISYLNNEVEYLEVILDFIPTVGAQEELDWLKRSLPFPIMTNFESPKYYQPKGPPVKWGDPVVAHYYAPDNYGIPQRHILGVEV